MEDMDIDYQGQDDVGGVGGVGVDLKISHNSPTRIVDHAFLIMMEFPLISSWNHYKYWTGFIQGQNKLVRVAVGCPNFPFCVEASIQGDTDSLKIFASFQAVIDKMLISDGLLLDLLKELKSCIIKYENEALGDSLDGENSISIGSSNPDFFLVIFNELDSIGVEVVESVTKDFQQLSMKYVDQLQRKHVIKVVIPHKYPQAPVKVHVDLPPPSDAIDWPPMLADVYDRFKAEVDKYVLFWSVMDELDNQARVIDPIRPTRGDIHRRILLNANVVVNLLFNPQVAKGLPEIKFSGPEKSIHELEVLMDNHCKEWEEDKPILENLEDILRCDFLLKTESEDEENQNGSTDDMEKLCVICYAIEFAGCLPETTCECGSVYHDKCLSDLLVNDCSVKAKRFCVDCPVCGLELKVSKAIKVTW